MAGAVDVRVVASLRGVLDDTGVDCDAALLLLGRVVDLVVRDELGKFVLGEYSCDRGGECGLAMVHVADRANVQVRLIAHEHLLHPTCGWRCQSTNPLCAPHRHSAVTARRSKHGLALYCPPAAPIGAGLEGPAAERCRRDDGRLAWGLHCAFSGPPLKKHPLARIGPGLITGVADDDPSGIATYSQAGAQFGLNMLWTMPLAYPLMAAIQSICARIGRVTGKGIAANIKTSFPPVILYVRGALQLLIANTLNIAADVAAMGEVFRARHRHRSPPDDAGDRRRRRCCCRCSFPITAMFFF